MVVYGSLNLLKMFWGWGWDRSFTLRSQQFSSHTYNKLQLGKVKALSQSSFLGTSYLCYTVPDHYLATWVALSLIASFFSASFTSKHFLIYLLFSWKCWLPGAPCCAPKVWLALSRVPWGRMLGTGKQCRVALFLKKLFSTIQPWP